MKKNSTHQTSAERTKKYRDKNKDIAVSNQNVELLDKLRPVYEAELGIVKLSRSWVVNHLIERAADAKLGIAAADDGVEAAPEAKTGGAAQAPQNQSPVTGNAEERAGKAVTGDGEAEGLAPAPSVTRNTLFAQPAPASPSNGDGDGTPSQYLTSFKGGRIITSAATITVAFEGPDDRRFAVKASGFGYDGTTQSWCRKFSSEASREQFLPALTQYLTDPSDQNKEQLIRAVNFH